MRRIKPPSIRNKIKLSDAAELDGLMDENAYREFLKSVS